MLDILNINLSIVSPKSTIIWASRNILGVLYIGEVIYVNTINYTTGEPLTGGLFCEKVFGPIISWKCGCLSVIKVFKHICLKCGYEINTNFTRRFRMGVVFLQTPIFHTWYFDLKSSILPILLNCSNSILNNLIYYVYCKNIKTYIYIPNIIAVFKKLYLKQLIYINFYIKNYFKYFNIIENIITIKEYLLTSCNMYNNMILYKKLLFLNIFFFNKLELSWILLDNFPIIPPNFRPIIKINNHFIISNINNIYKNILLHNNKLKIFTSIKIKIPLIFEINEKIKLQKTIDKFLNKNFNYKNSNIIIKTLSGKHGIFRQNLLGKRIDYSGRSVITSGPDLNFSKVGIPLSIACELFTPLLINIVKKYKSIKYIFNNFNLKTSILYRRLITRMFKTNIILLNRAPTLHRVNIQGFKPYLIEGRAIRLYPIVCSSFNADFDGDQMSIIITLIKSSRLEAKYIISSDKNFLSPATGVNLFKLSQIILLGLYFINTMYYKKNSLVNIYFNNLEDILNYCSVGLITQQSCVWVKFIYIDINSNYLKNYFVFTNISRFILTKLIHL